MTVKENAAYFGTTGKLEVLTDDYTAAVTSCALTPNAPEATVTDIGGGVTNLVGANAWQADIGYNQDWKTTDSFSRKLREWHGQTKVMKYTPDSGGDIATFTALIKAGRFGGDNSKIHDATITLKVNGQPTFAPAP